MLSTLKPTTFLLEKSHSCDTPALQGHWLFSFQPSNIGESGFVAAVKRLTTIHFGVAYIYLSFGIMVSIVEL